MAVVPMQKVRLVIHESDVESALDIVQCHGALDFRVTDTEVLKRQAEVIFPNEQLLPRMQHAVQFLEPYYPKVGLWRNLRDGVDVELTETEITSRVQDTDAIESVVSDLELLQVEFAESQEKVRQLELQHKALREWHGLSLPLHNLKTKHTKTLLVTRDALKEQEFLPDSITKVFSDAALPHILTAVSETKAAITVSVEAEMINQSEKLIGSIGAAIAPELTGSETPEVEILATSEHLAKAKGELAMLHDQAEHFAITHLKNLQVASEAIGWQRDRHAVTDSALATEHAVVFDGWLNEQKRSAVETAFKEQNLAVAIDELELAVDEEPPVEISNSPLVQPFEAVTRLYGMPGYKDLDPTVFLAGFFFLFFGMSLTDVGYGLFLMVVAAIVLTLFKVAPPVRMFAKLLLFVGFSTVLVGLLFGGYLGIDTKYIPDFLKQLQIYDPIGNPLPVFYTALGLGVFQVMFGIVLKIYSEYRNGRFLTGVLDQGPWLFVFVIGILYLATSTGYITAFALPQLVNLLYVGLVMVVLSSGRKGSGVLEKLKNAALSLYDSIGYFSDILSYSRLLALGLATTALAFAVNLIASMVVDVPYVGAILALMILLIGHLFTLAVNTLGAFIHSARLQFVEFFGKFISGTGRSFAPLSRKKKYIAVKDE